MTSLPADMWKSIIQYCPLDQAFSLRPIARVFQSRSVSYLALHNMTRVTLMQSLACCTKLIVLSVRESWFGLPAVRLLTRMNIPNTLHYVEFVDCSGLTSLALNQYLKYFPECDTMLRVVRCPVLVENRTDIEPYLTRIIKSRTDTEETAAFVDFDNACPDSDLGKAIWRLDWFGLPYNEQNTSRVLNGSLLLSAVSQQNVRLVCRLLERRVRMDGSMKHFTPLHLACALDNLQLVKSIVRAINFDNTSPLLFGLSCSQMIPNAARFEDQISTDHWRMLNMWYNADCADAFLIACALASPDIVRYLHDQIHHTIIGRATCYTPIETAVRHNRLDIVQTLLELRYQDEVQHSGVTALTIACDMARWDMARLLLLHQPPRDQLLHRMSSALHSCCRQGQRDMVELLLTRPEWVEAIDEPDRYGVTPCFHAAAAGHDDIVQILIQTGAQLNDPYVMGTPIHAAIVFNRTEVLKTLFQHGGCPFRPMQTFAGPVTGYELARFIPHVSNATLIVVLHRAIQIPNWPSSKAHNADTIKTRGTRVLQRFKKIIAEPEYVF